MATLAALALARPALAQRRASWVIGAEVGYYEIGIIYAPTSSGLAATVGVGRHWPGVGAYLRFGHGAGADDFTAAALDLELHPFHAATVSPIGGVGAGLMKRSGYTNLFGEYHVRLGVGVDVTVRDGLRLLLQRSGHVDVDGSKYAGPHALLIGWIHGL